MKKLLKKTPSFFDGGAMFVCAFLFMYLGQILLSLILEASLNNAAAFINTMACQYIFMALNQVCIVGAIFVYGKISGVAPIRVAGVKRGLNLKQTAMLLPIAVLCILAFMPLAQLFLMALSAMGFSGGTTIPSAQSVGGLFLSFLVIAVLPAIGEEFVFRGNVAQGLKQKGYGFAIVISSVLFGLFHGNALQLVHQALLGAVMCYVAFATGSFWGAAIIHFINNAIALLLDFILLKSTGSSAVQITLNPWLLAFIFIVVSLIAIYFLLTALCFYTELCRKKKGLEVSGVNAFKSAFSIICRAFTPKGFKANRQQLNASLEELSFAEVYEGDTAKEEVVATVSNVSTTDDADKKAMVATEGQSVALAEGEQPQKSAKELAEEQRANEEKKLQEQLKKERLRKDKKADIMSIIVAFAIVGIIWIFQLVQGFLPEKKAATEDVSGIVTAQEYEN